MRRGEIWFAATPGGDRPVLLLTPDPVAARIGAVMVAALTRTERGLVSELKLSRARDGVPTDCVVSFDNLHTVPARRFGAASPRLAHRAWRILAVPSATLSAAEYDGERTRGQKQIRARLSRVSLPPRTTEGPCSTVRRRQTPGCPIRCRRRPHPDRGSNLTAYALSHDDAAMIAVHRPAPGGVR